MTAIPEDVEIDIPYIVSGIRRYLLDVDEQPGDCGYCCPCEVRDARESPYGWRWSLPTVGLPPWSWLVAGPGNEAPQ